MSNWGNLPNAVVMSVTQQAPFDPTTDPALGVSFVSIFIVPIISSSGFAEQPILSHGTTSQAFLKAKKQKQRSLEGETHRRARRTLHPGREPACREPSVSASTVTKKDADSMMIEGKEKIRDVEVAVPQIGPQYLACGHPDPDPDVQLARRTSRLSTSPSYRSRRPSFVPSPPQVASEHPPHLSFPQRMLRVFRPLTAIVTPITLTLAISLPMALIQPLKALFVDVSTTGGPDWKGPDGRPPLAFIIDTADFLGSIAVPLALILLGASFARLKIPRPISRLPIMAMMLVTLAKMVILPVAGVFIVQAMVHGGLIDKDAKAEKFVAMFLSGTPAAVNQMIVASLYSPDGNVDTLSAFLLVQYVFMFFSSAQSTDGGRTASAVTSLAHYGSSRKRQARCVWPGTFAACQLFRHAPT
ncbi:Protein ECM3 [Grifola frondosa]|uniref:Protein ECM3 n=1 Tax=Grifola frondosa TaxID=5627 RepID=A0A1C7M0U2_GRIFR|nr:Protein ECM3 [Grifola frondosa]